MKILIMAGGTGGHIYPALAVAKVLKNDKHQVVWLGSKKGMENEIVPSHNIAIKNIDISGLRGNGLLRWFAAPIKILFAVKQAIKIIQKQQPGVVLGFGGFVSFPGAIAAKLLRIPLVIHEQNAIAGLSNRLLRFVANKVLQAFPNTLKGGETVGNPVRADIENIALKIISNPLNILILGGSLGAKSLNKIVPSVITNFSDINIWHQTGRNKLTDTLQAYQGVTSAKVVEFIDNMHEALSWADVVVCRAGAMTIFELSASGTPALLVPYPYAVDDHQTKNAKFLVENNAAILRKDIDFTVDFLSKTLKNWLKNTETLNKMAQNAKNCYISNSATNVAKFCLKVEK